MSWGERSCKRPCRCPQKCKMETCNVDCSSYEWDGVTKPDSASKIMKYWPCECPFIVGQNRCQVHDAEATWIMFDTPLRGYDNQRVQEALKSLEELCRSGKKLSG